MSKHVIKNLFTKPRSLSFVAFLVLLVFFLGKLSSLGFALSNYLASYPMVSYVASIFFIVTGFLVCYYHLAFYASWTISLAIRVYFFAALGMSGIYYIVSSLHFGCFSLPSDISTLPSIVDFIYFSFVTITTVGYGDIVPRHTFVRVLVLSQVLFGLYLVLKCTQTERDKRF